MAKRDRGLSLTFDEGSRQDREGSAACVRQRKSVVCTREGGRSTLHHLLADVLYGVREVAEDLVLLGVGAFASGVNPASAACALCERRT